MTTMKTTRLALVTGGVGGIGTAICKRLAQDGCFVVANYAIPAPRSAGKRPWPPPA
jgi:acetoacetyl-CoA reductase